MHVLITFPDLVFLVKHVAFLAGSLFLFIAFLGFDDPIELPIIIVDRQILKDSALVLVIMNQRSYQVKCSVHDHQSTARFSKCQLHSFLRVFLSFLLFRPICIDSVVIIEIFKLFVDASSDSLADNGVGLVLNVRPLAHDTAHRI